MALNTEGERINSLCKKYFTPELCETSVTESKATLKGKIYTQLLAFGDYLGRGKSKSLVDKIDFELISELVVQVIESCWENWSKKPRELNYTQYFAQSMRNALLKFVESNHTCISLDENLQDKSENKAFSLSTILEDKRNSIDAAIERQESIAEVEDYLKAIGVWFKSRKREEWNKTAITAELYDGLHRYFDQFPHRKPSRFCFIDEKVYHLPSAPSNKYIAQLLAKDEGQISKMRKKFRSDIELLLKKAPLANDVR